jgi:asparagine synthase (glutamine-hydrolysing)
MCGIFAILNYSDSNSNSNLENNNNYLNLTTITNNFNKGVNRGPENSILEIEHNLSIIKGFHRLAINGLNDISNQPLIVDKYSLICNGEIYNYKQLYKLMDVTPTTDSDCEVIIHLYIRYGIQQTLRMLDGVFAFVLFCPNNIYVARDPFGVRPLYYTRNALTNTLTNTLTNKIIGFASELKTLCDTANALGQKVMQFTPGTFMVIDKSIDFECVSWLIKDQITYHIPLFSSTCIDYNYETCLKSIRYYLSAAVEKRYITTERPIACLLSGGLDSSLIAALVCRSAINTNSIETYSIGLPDSEDVKYARMVADHIGSKHTEIIVTEQDMLQIIPEVVKAIESYDTTTIRASIGNYLIGKYIKEHSLAKVIFNGDGSDELAGGYLYMSSCPDSIEYDKETLRLLKDIHLFDVLRSDKCISSHGLEPRTPFLDKAFVNYYLSIPLEYRNHNLSQNKIEKYLIREAFSNDNLLPRDVLWRKKEAFSDGVSNKGKSLFQIIQDYTDAQVLNPSLNLKQKERQYYKDIFNEAYPNHLDIVPYYWMPKYILSDDPSARTLASYK